MEESAPAKFSYTKLSRREFTASHGQAAASGRKHMEDIRVLSQSPISHLNVHGLCFKGVFFSALENNFTAELRNHCQQSQIPLIFIKTAKSSEIVICFFHRKLVTSSDKEKNISAQCACSQGNRSVQLSKSFHFCKARQYVRQTSMWILPLVCGCVYARDLE